MRDGSRRPAGSDLAELSRLVAEADFGAGPAAARARLAAYLETHPQMLGPYREMTEMWTEAGRLPAPPLPADRKRTGRRTRWRGLPAAAAALAAVVVLGVALGHRMLAGGSTLLETGRGERRVVHLADGSRVSLSADTALRVSLKPRERRLSLLRGEALFDVAHDAERPFVVGAGNGEVRALGTVFSVRVDAARDVTVTVLSGRVKVAAQDPPAAGPRPAHPQLSEIAAANQQVVYGARGPLGSPVETASFITPPAVVDARQSVGWTQGVLRFDGEPLAKVVEEVNRHARDQIVLSDPSLRDARIYGVLHAGDVQGLVSILRDAHDEHGRSLAGAVSVERAAP